ncbi:MAG TPA: hypothetical protein VFA73_07465 [Actinomycetota bacterium]|nr:hypothetical protein [Actinomycetota bacterium]
MAVGDQRARVLYRLPEQRRFGASGTPRLLTLVLLAIVLFLGGMVIGRASMTRNDGGAATATSAPAAAATPSPTVAATPGTAAAAPAEGAATKVGPRRFKAGVGVGYARSQQGAVAAAANYTSVLSSDLLLDTTRRRAAIDALAAPEAKARLQKTFDQAVVSLRQGLGVTGGADDGTQVLLRATPVGWRVEDYDNGAAKVAIWVTSVGGSIGGKVPVPIREGWGTTTVTLRWAGGDWKQVESTTTDGPVPIADVAPPTAAPELVDKANEFKEFTYAPGP